MPEITVISTKEEFHQYVLDLHFKVGELAEKYEKSGSNSNFADWIFYGDMDGKFDYNTIDLSLDDVYCVDVIKQMYKDGEI